MAGKLFTYGLDVTHDTSLETVAQFLVATNDRVILHGIDVLPLGATAATTPLQWRFGVQTTAGTATGDSANLEKVPPTYSASLATTVQKTFTAEPTLSTPTFDLVVHQQAGLYRWLPNGKPIVMESDERWGLWYLASQYALAVRYKFYLEE